MTREEFFSVLREAASEEFAHIPDEDEIEYEFSERFNKKWISFSKRLNATATIRQSEFQKEL